MKKSCYWLAVAALPFFVAADVHTYPGITEPVKDETFSSTVAGRIDRVAFKEGDRVDAGAIVVALDNRMETLEVERRKLVLDDKSKLEAAKIRAASKQAVLEVERRKLIWETKDELTAARKRLETVQKDLAGTKELFQTTQSVSKDEVAIKELEVSISAAEVAELESREKREKLEYDVALDNSTLTDRLNEAQISALEREEQREKIEYNAAVEQLSRRNVRTSIGGMVRKVFLQEGESCTVGEALVQVVDVSRVRFIANVHAKIAAGLKSGQKVELLFELTNEKVTRSGTITFLSPVVDAASGLREVHAEFENDDLTITPGIAGSIRFEVSE